MNINPRHVSDSIEQREAETIVLSLVQVEVGCSLAGETLSLGNGAVVKVDGINYEHKIVCEAYCRIGKLKGSQPDKIASDMLKLVLAESALGGTWRKIICLADSDAAKCIRGRSWLAIAARQLGFEVIVVDLPPDARRRILAAQGRQIMVNPR